MYKDKDKQRAAVRQATQRYRAKGITQERNHVIPVIPTQAAYVIPRIEPTATAAPVKQQSHNPMMVGYVPPKDNT